MSFMSATQIGKEVGLSYQKVNKILAAENLYDNETKRPTHRALENNLAKIKTTESRFTGKAVEYIAWNFKVLEELFPKQALEEMVLYRCRHSSDAHKIICAAFSDFGDMLDLHNEPHKKISNEAVSAVVQSYFSDPDYLRGTLLYHRYMRTEEVEAAKRITFPLAEELFKAAKRIDATRAKNCLRTIEIVFGWLADKAC